MTDKGHHLSYQQYNFLRRAVAESVYGRVFPEFSSMKYRDVGHHILFGRDVIRRYAWVKIDKYPEFSRRDVNLMREYGLSVDRLIQAIDKDKVDKVLVHL